MTHFICSKCCQQVSKASRDNRRMTRQTAVIMHSQQVARSQCSSCKGGTVAAYRLRPLHRPAPLIRCAQRRTQNDRIGRSGASVRAQAQSEKKEQEASASAQESTSAQRDGQADNVTTPLQEQLPNQQVRVVPTQHQLVAYRVLQATS